MTQKSAASPGPTVGAGLLAKAACQSPSISTDPPHSRASSLPQGIGGLHK
ncbi:metal ABC transporter ATP-binding protein, partial [Pseudomonas nunensis]|nr:metal ABC transporter ATP-binding protein [Pseudomonas nunensis]